MKNLVFFMKNCVIFMKYQLRPQLWVHLVVPVEVLVRRRVGSPPARVRGRHGVVARHYVGVRAAKQPAQHAHLHAGARLQDP